MNEKNIKQLLEYMFEINESLLNNENNLESKLVNYKIILKDLEEENLKDDENYNKILENCSNIPSKIEECIKTRNEQSTNFNNIRKMEELLEKYKSMPDGKDENMRSNNIKKINSELEKIKSLSNKVSDLVIEQSIEFIESCKEQIVSYMINEKESDKVYVTENDKVEDIETDKAEYIEPENEKIQENVIENETVLEDTVSYLEPEVQNEIEELDIKKRVKNECKENIEIVQELLDNINELSNKQQNHKRIANELGISYKPLNNVLQINSQTEILASMLNKITTRVNELCGKEINYDTQIELERISQTNIGIKSLFKYLKDSKSFDLNNVKSRFEEMIEIEEKELERLIVEKARDIRSTAELKKLKDDLRIIEKKGIFNKFIGTFTGRNKIDNFVKNQIEYRKMAIKNTLSKKVKLTQNYNIDELMAEITMFINDNKDDALVRKDVLYFQALAQELRKNYDVLENKVQTIIERREGKNSLYDKRKVSKKEIMELETHKFLNKYGYNTYDISDEEICEYRDTMPSEIDRIIEYIKASNVI